MVEPERYRGYNCFEGCFSHGYLRGKSGERGDRDHDEKRGVWTVDLELFR